MDEAAVEANEAWKLAPGGSQLAVCTHFSLVVLFRISRAIGLDDVELYFVLYKVSVPRETNNGQCTFAVLPVGSSWL